MVVVFPVVISRMAVMLCVPAGSVGLAAACMPQPTSALGWGPRVNPRGMQLLGSGKTVLSVCVLGSSTAIFPPGLALLCGMAT